MTALPHESPQTEERERFFSRLSTIAGLRPMPSIGDWILIEVEDPSDVARKVNRRLEPGVVSVPRHVPGAVRIPVGTPKQNEALFRTLRDVVTLRKARSFAGFDDDLDDLDLEDEA